MADICDNRVLIVECDLPKLKRDLEMVDGKIILSSTKVVPKPDEEDVDWWKTNRQTLGVGRHFDLIVKGESIEDLTQDLIMDAETICGCPEAFIEQFIDTYNISGEWHYSYAEGDYAGFYAIVEGEIDSGADYFYDDEDNILFQPLIDLEADDEGQ